jgi:uncharacterized membrane protein
VDFPATQFPKALFWLCNGLMALVFVAAVRQAPLRRLWINEFTHVFFGACVAVLLLWNTRVGVLPALNFHLLGMTSLTLMFGWPFAVFGALLVSSGSIISQQGAWISLGANALVMGCVPVLVTELLLRVAQRRLPHNFFIYVYINGFLAAGLSMVAAGLVGALLMLLADPGNSGWLADQYLPYLPLLFLSEALVNGMVMSGMVALRPGWVQSFDDTLYLDGK